MKMLKVLFTVTIMLTSGLLLTQEPKKAAEQYAISVLPIENSNEISGDFNRLMAEDFINEQIIKIPIYRVLERSKLESILQEQKLQITGVIYDETIVNIGNLTGARFLLQPTIIKIEDTLEGTP
jgi:hypothetical protein